MLRFAFHVSFLLIAVAYAFWRGGRPEKQAAATLLAMLVFDRAYHALGAETGYFEVDVFHVFNDGWALLALLSIALTADRFWPLWIAALQVIAFCAHYVRIADLTVPPIVYAVMIRFPYWLQIAVLLFGTWNFARRRNVSAGFNTSLRS